MTYIHLRNLKIDDAPLMLEWMQDKDIASNFRFDTASMTLETGLSFITNSNNDSCNRHFAVADKDDIYLGTISLKNIDADGAEYAIVMRRCAHGSGAAKEATRQILEYAFNKLRLKRVYLNVLTDNLRANAFYRKCGFQFIRVEENALTIHGQQKDLNWYDIRRV